MISRGSFFLEAYFAGLQSSLSLIEAAGFVAIAAHFHVAPAAAVAFTFVEEKPAAGFGSTFADVREIRRG